MQGLTWRTEAVRSLSMNLGVLAHREQLNMTTAAGRKLAAAFMSKMA